MQNINNTSSSGESQNGRSSPGWMSPIIGYTQSSESFEFGISNLEFDPSELFVCRVAAGRHLESRYSDLGF